MPIATSIDFRDFVSAAYQAQRAEETAAEAEHSAGCGQATSAAVVKWFGCAPDSAQGFVATKDGVELLYHPSDDGPKGYWQVMGPCLKCGELVESPGCDSVGDVGKYVAAHKPGWDHFCEPEPEDTPEARLIAALRAFIAEACC